MKAKKRHRNENSKTREVRIPVSRLNQPPACFNHQSPSESLCAWSGMKSEAHCQDGKKLPPCRISPQLNVPSSFLMREEVAMIVD